MYERLSAIHAENKKFQEERIETLLAPNDEKELINLTLSPLKDLKSKRFNFDCPSLFLIFNRSLCKSTPCPRHYSATYSFC